MTEKTPKVVAFACRWSLGDEQAELGGAKLIPVICSGRVSPGFILQAFEWGAAGVLVAGCGTKDCRYLFGAKQQEGQFAMVREVVELLGIGAERIQLSWVKGPEELEKVTAEFTKKIEALGPAPIVPTAVTADVPEIKELREASRAFACIDCGKCTGFCPVSRYTKGYSPHRIVAQSLFKDIPEREVAEAVWSCFTCGLCERRCPAAVKYSSLQQGLRRRARADGETGQCTHSGSLLSIMRLHAHGDHLPQKRLEWLPDDVKVAETGDTALFVGCAPYFDQVFKHMGVKTTDATIGAIRLLNAMGIEPVIMGDEICCGHDLLWSGDRENFEILAKKNVEKMKARGITRVVHACAECYRTASKDWAEVTGKLDFSNVHVTELVADSKLKLNGDKVKATIQDPCRLTRHMGKGDALRGAIAKSPSIEVKEMMRHGVAANCCGSSSWLNCSAGTAALQQVRLGEARATGAEVLLAACPKCEIHLACSQFGKDDKIEIRNVASVLSEALPGATDAPRKSEG